MRAPPTPSLRVAEDLGLPIESVTQTFSILAKRGSGKTYLGMVLAEEMLREHLPIVVIDPMGAWWGLRANADGKTAGYPITILGGEHGDAPLESTAGTVIADLIVEERVPLVLDVSMFSKSEQVRFVADFSERLYQKNREPLHMFMDECDRFAPQRPMPGHERCLGAVDDIVRRGRIRGLGITMISQRPAVIHKDVLTQTEVMIVMRLAAPQDHAAVKAWIQHQGAEGQAHELLASLPALPIGTAWFLSPGWLNVFQRVKVRERQTFDSSATPKVGQQLRRPRVLATVDLERIRARMSETIERAQADDPKALKARIVKFQQELAATRAELVAAREALSTARETLAKRIEVPVVPQLVVDTVQRAIREIGEVREQTQKTLAAISEQLRLMPEIEHEHEPTLMLPTQFTDEEISYLKAKLKKDAPQPDVSTTRSTHPRMPPLGDTRFEFALANGQKKILDILAMYPTGRTHVQLAIMTGYSHKGGGFNNYMSSLRTRGLIHGKKGKIQITDNGRAVASTKPLPRCGELLEHWKTQLPKAERNILQYLYDICGRTVTKQEIATQLGYEVAGGGFNNALSKLRTLELIERNHNDVCLSRTFVEAV